MNYICTVFKWFFSFENKYSVRDRSGNPARLKKIVDLFFKSDFRSYLKSLVKLF